jgi:hypothetical protein
MTRLGPWSLLALCAAGSAQDRGAIAGKILDEFDEPVYGASVVARNGAGEEFKTTSKTAGYYRLEKLVPGNYRIAVSLSLLDHIEPQVAVQPGTALSLDITLATPAGPAPRLADGKPDFSGFWLPQRPAQNAPPSDQPQPRPWADTIRTERRISNMRDDPYGRCLPGSIIDLAGRGRFVHVPGFLAMQQNPTSFEPPREIFVDGRAHPQDVNPTWKGHSIARWEGETLVIDTVGFSGMAWYGGGLPSTESLHVIERYRRPDLGHLEIEITVQDAAVLLTPWTRKRTAKLAPAQDIDEEVCVENNKDPALMVGK